MKDLKLFGTDAWPLHPSGLRGLITCQWSTTMRYLFDPDDEGGVAGDTGSAAHVAAAALHTGKGAADAIQAMVSGKSRYPLADMNDAAGIFLKYAADPRNHQAEVVKSEAKVHFTIAPAPEDKTQAPIAVTGTLDQIRRESRLLKLWDLKTSKKDPIALLNQHIYQMAAYCVGGTILMGEPVHPGGLILPRKYKADGSGPVFWHFAWTFEDLEHILEPVRLAVARIRNGQLTHVPNDNCQWCVGKSPDLCLPKLKSHKLSLV